MYDRPTENGFFEGDLTIFLVLHPGEGDPSEVALAEP